MNITVYLSSSTGNNSNKKSLALPYVKSGILSAARFVFIKKRLNQQAQVMRLTMPRLCLRVQILFYSIWL